MGCRRGDIQQVLSLQDTQGEEMPIVGVSGSDTESDVPSRNETPPCCVECRSTFGGTDGTHSVASVGQTCGSRASWSTCPSCNSPPSMFSIFVPFQGLTPPPSTASVVSEPIQFHE